MRLHEERNIEGSNRKFNGWLLVVSAVLLLLLLLFAWKFPSCSHVAKGMNYYMTFSRSGVLDRLHIYIC